MEFAATSIKLAAAKDMTMDNPSTVTKIEPVCPTNFGLLNCDIRVFRFALEA